jgi:hypothetical protein
LFIINALWKYVNAQESVTEPVLESIDLEIFKYVKDEFDYKADEWFVSYHTIITSLARSLNLTIGMIRRGARQTKMGYFDNSTGELRMHERPAPGDKNLLCVASTRTLRNGGEVFVLSPERMPNNSPIAAVLRT